MVLRALRPEDATTTLTWRHDPFINDRVVAPTRFVSLATEQAWIGRAIKEHEEGRHLRLGICMSEDAPLIGIVHLSHIDALNRTCRTGILIGAPDLRGRGIAREVYPAVLRHAFNELGMNCIRAFVMASNDASLRLYRGLGFKQEGVQRAALFKAGGFHDLVMLSLLASEHSAHG